MLGSAPSPSPESPAPAAGPDPVTARRADTRTYTFAVDRVAGAGVWRPRPSRPSARTLACGLELPGAGPYLVLGYLQNGVLWANPAAVPGGGHPSRARCRLPTAAGPAPAGSAWIAPQSGRRRARRGRSSCPCTPPPVSRSEG